MDETRIPLVNSQGLDTGGEIPYHSTVIGKSCHRPSSPEDSSGMRWGLATHLGQSAIFEQDPEQLNLHRLELEQSPRNQIGEIVESAQRTDLLSSPAVLEASSSSSGSHSSLLSGRRLSGHGALYVDPSITNLIDQKSTALLHYFKIAIGRVWVCLNLLICKDLWH